MFDVPHHPQMIAWATEVRVGKPDDARAVAELHLRSAAEGFRTFFPADVTPRSVEALEDNWASLLSNDPSQRCTTFVSERDGKIVGVIVAHWDTSNPPVGRLSRAYIEPRFWGSGSARLLLDAAVNRLREVGCARAAMWIMEPNHRTRKMMEHVGFTFTGVRQPTCEVARSAGGGIEDLEYEGSL